MYLMKDIIKEGNPVLKEIATEVKLPINITDLEVLKNLHEYVVASQIDKLVEQYQIRPGVGIAAPQVGISKRMFAIEFNDFLDENSKHYSMCVINPKIIKRSDEITYLPDGEGCLSVDRETHGITPRNYAIIVKTYLYDFITNKMSFKTLELKGYPAIVFQHEYDHLDGIMYVDKLFDKLDNAFPLYEVNTEETEDEK